MKILVRAATALGRSARNEAQRALPNPKRDAAVGYTPARFEIADEN
jgi:hypothetical protein